MDGREREGQTDRQTDRQRQTDGARERDVRAHAVALLLTSLQNALYNLEQYKTDNYIFLFCMIISLPSAVCL